MSLGTGAMERAMTFLLPMEMEMGISLMKISIRVCCRSVLFGFMDQLGQARAPSRIQSLPSLSAKGDILLPFVASETNRKTGALLAKSY